MQALVASSRRVSRINQHQSDSSSQTFVSQKLPQLIEAPAIASTSLSLVSRLGVCPVTDASQVFKCYPDFSHLSLLDNAVTDSVVQPSLKPSLLTRQPLQEFSAPAPTTSCAFTGFLLKILSQLSVVISYPVNRFSIPAISCTRVSNISPAQIYTQTLVHSLRLWWLRFNLHLDVVIPIRPLKQRGTGRVFSCQQMPLIITNQQRELMSIVQQGNSDRPSILPKSEDSSIIPSASWLKLFDWKFFSFSSLPITSNAQDSLTNQVSWQSKGLFCQMIYLFVNSKPACYLGVNCLVNPVTTVSKSLKCGVNFLPQVRLNLQFATDCKHLCSHTYSLLYICNSSQFISVVDPALPFLPSQIICSGYPGRLKDETI